MNTKEERSSIPDKLLAGWNSTMDTPKPASNSKGLPLPRNLPAPPEWRGRLVVFKDGAWILTKADSGLLVTADQVAVRAVAMAAFRAVQKKSAGYSGILPAVLVPSRAIKARSCYCIWRDA